MYLKFCHSILFLIPSFEFRILIYITINPVSWPYHEAPVDCWRIFPLGMEALAEEAGLSVELCLFDSLEQEQIILKDPSTNFIPGKSYNYSSNPNLLSFVIKWNKLIKKLPGLRKCLIIPMEVAFDCVSIFQKT